MMIFYEDLSDEELDQKINLYESDLKRFKNDDCILSLVQDVLFELKKEKLKRENKI